MALNPGTTEALRKAGEYGARQNLPPATPATTGHATSSLGEGVTASASGSAGGSAVLRAVGKGFAAALEWEKKVSAPFAGVPYPGMPASVSLAMIRGFPHAHDHWPNNAIVPPIPIPFPSDGPVIPLPVVSCADKVFIAKRNAARCGDIGLSIWCGGYFPINEVFFGSASVWIESARAGRLLDLTKQCLISKAKPKDIPLGPPIGALTNGIWNTYIGGAPMPSVTGLALAGALKGIGKAAQIAARGLVTGARAAAALFRAAAVATRNLIDQHLVLRRFLKFVKITGDDLFKKGALADIRKMASTAVGRARLNSLVNRGKPLELKSVSSLKADGRLQRAGTAGDASVYPAINDCRVRTAPSSNSPLWKAVQDPNGNYQWERSRMAGPGQGSGSTIYYEPGANLGTTPTGGAQTPSDVVLAHEMSHADNAASGTMKDELVKDDAWNKRWKNVEEYEAVQNENAYRVERGLPQRNDYTSPLP